jgi:hypothetical protein
MKNVVAALAVVVGCALAAPASAQDAVAARVTELTLRDGSRVYGTVVRQSDVEVVFRSTAGVVMTAPRAEILALRDVDVVLSGAEFVPADPNTTRLFFAPTGRALKRGEAYLGAYEFLLPTVQVGVTDRLSIGGGTPLVFGFADEADRPFWVTPKLQVMDSGRTQVAVGVLHAFAGDEGGGVAYAVATHGTAARSLTMGGGLAYNGNGGRAGVFMLGGDRVVRRNMKLITENYLASTGVGAVSGGVRFFGDRLSADLALVLPIVETPLGVFPVVNFVYLFGR